MPKLSSTLSPTVARKAIYRHQVTTAKIGPPRPFSLFVSKTYKTVTNLPFNKRLATLAVAYAELTPSELTSLKAEAQKNAVLRQSFRVGIKCATTARTPFTVFAESAKNKALYGELGFKKASRTIAVKYKALSASEKAALMEKADKKNEQAKQYIVANESRPCTARQSLKKWRRLGI